MEQVAGGAAGVKSLIDEVNSRGHLQAQGVQAISASLEAIQKVAEANAASAQENASLGGDLDTIRSPGSIHVVSLLEW